jgi:hypothetical protein
MLLGGYITICVHSGTFILECQEPRKVTNFTSARECISLKVDNSSEFCKIWHWHVYNGDQQAKIGKRILYMEKPTNIGFASKQGIVEIF